MTPCNVCGSTRAAIFDGRCKSVMGCDRRRITRRIEEDRKRGGRQCMASRGSVSIRFCLMRENHSGKHTDGGREWGSEEETPTGRLFATVFKSRGA